MSRNSANTFQASSGIKCRRVFFLTIRAFSQWSRSPYGNAFIDWHGFRIVSLQVEEYEAAQAQARKDHLGIWEYGDITEDDAKEFGRL